MTDLEQEIRRRYLDTLDEPIWDVKEPRLQYGVRALPCFVRAFERELSLKRRARLVSVIWQFRDPAALPTLAIALHDPQNDVWKNALDGFVTLAGEQALAILRQERIPVAADPNLPDKLSWIDEAITQVIDEMKRQCASESTTD